MKKLFCLVFVLLFTGAGRAADPTVSKDTVEEKAPGYSIHVVVPLLGSGDARVDDLFNQNSRKFAQLAIARFKKNYSDSVGGGPADPAWSLDMEFEQEFSNDRLLGLMVTGYEFTGGAHGMPILYTLVFDRKQGKKLSPQDLFRPGAAFLERLSEYSRAELSKRDLMSDPDWIQRGAAPQKENYQLVMPVKEGLKVYFAPYQVAPYAAGIQTVVVPYAKLADILQAWLP